jgi:hypothetical protein
MKYVYYYHSIHLIISISKKIFDIKTIPPGMKIMKESKKTENGSSPKKTSLLTYEFKGEGISEVDKKREMFEEKRKKLRDFDLSDEDKEKLLKAINNQLVFRAKFKDYVMFFIAQLLPLLFIGSSMFVPGLIYLPNEKYALLLLVLGGLFYLYGILRLYYVVVFKVEITPESIKWFTGIKNKKTNSEKIEKIEVYNGYYLYFIKLGGLLPFAIEEIKIVKNEQNFWIRTYPLRKTKGKKIAKAILYWASLNNRDDEIEKTVH